MAAKAGIIARVARTALTAEALAMASMATCRTRASLDWAMRSKIYGGTMEQKG
jgi:hypothetical protein